MALAQLSLKSLGNLGPSSPPPDLSLAVGTRKEMGWSRRAYGLRAALPWLSPRCPSQIHHTGRVWVQSGLLQEPDSQRAC